MDSPDLRRRLLLGLFQAALDRVSGRKAVAAALPPGTGAPVWIAAVGKAACAMALGAHDVLGPAVQRVLIITKYGHVAPQTHLLPGVEVVESAHPVPDERSLAAGARLLSFMEQLPQGVSPLFLVSGGASSLVEVLRDGVTFGQLAQLNEESLASGIDITELNARRSRLSRIKGGGLAMLLKGRPAQALFISDVPGDDPAVIGSGLMGPASQGPDQVTRQVVASVSDAVDAACEAARRHGLDVLRLPGRFDGDAARLAIRFAHELHLHAAQVCVWGGESTVQLPDSPGRGGRNQHMALAAARLLVGHPQLMVLAAGTDGTDGPGEDAGAMVDSETCSRVALAKLDAEECLRRADSGAALAASGDLIRTGPTGTNVGDLIIGLKLSVAAAQVLYEGGEAPVTRES